MTGDLISRKALISKMFPYGMPDGGNYGINARAVRDTIVGAKAVEAEPVVHAHWVDRPDGAYRICTNCRSGIPTMQRPLMWLRCPVCGAHMDEEVAE